MRFDRDKQASASTYVLPCTVFLILLFVPLFWLFVRQDSFLPLEKRYREEMPELTVKNLISGTWTNKAEDFLSDRMPGRSALLGIYNYGMRFVGAQNAQNIFITADGALVEAPCVWDEAGLNTRLGTISNMAKGVDVPVSLLIVPTAGHLAGDRLNGLAAACYFDERVVTIARQRLDGDVNLIDVLPAFVSSQEPLFYSTDHHWNARGAYLAYRQICMQLGLDPAAETDFIKTSYDGFYGTTYSRSGLWGKGSDTLEIWNDYTSVAVTFSDQTATYDSMFFEGHLTAASLDKYPVFLDGNHPLTVIDNLNHEDGRTLLLVKDSYANSVAPLLIHHFDKVVLVDLRYYKQDITQVIENYNVTDALVLYSTENVIHSTDLLFLWLK